MSKNVNIPRKYITYFITLSFFVLLFTPFVQPIPVGNFVKNLNTMDSFHFPEPINLNISLEESICRRMSVREFTGEGVTNEELSTILWHSYGFNKKGLRNIHGITNEYPIKIYVLTDCGVWCYKPENHSLNRYRLFNMRWIGQYDTATVKIGLVWDKNKCNDKDYAGAVIGEICQNVYLTCNALDLGTVTTAIDVSQLKFIGLPRNEEPMIIMPIGHPKEPYHFTYDPIISDMPAIQNSTISLSHAILNRNDAIAWEETDISNQQQTQIIWSSYGESYYIDEINNKRHKTVPSSRGSYPFTIYCVNKTGVYRYISELHHLEEIKKGDYRKEVANASENFISNASLFIISVINTTSVYEKYLWAWYYEAAAAAYNVLLESTAQNLSSNIIININTAAIAPVLGLNSEEFLPIFINPVGKEKTIENHPPEITIEQPEKALYLFGNKKRAMHKPLIIGPLKAKINLYDDNCLKSVHYFIDGKSVKFCNGPSYEINLPFHLMLKQNILSIKAHDYEGKSDVTCIRFIKLL